MTRQWAFHNFQTGDVRAGRLRYAVNSTPGAAVCRWLVFLNGRTEWIEKYRHLPRSLGLADDCGFLTWDHRGQGASDGARASIDTYDTYASDTRRIIEAVTGECPYTLLTHSMGGLIGLYSCLRRAIAPKRLILSSPLLGFYGGALPQTALRAVSRLANSLGLGSLSAGAGNFLNAGFENNALTHCREMFELSRSSPYPVGSVTLAWLQATLDAVKFVFTPDNVGGFAVPTLLMAAGEDRVVDCSAIEKWAALAARRSKAAIQVQTISGARHELFAELPPYRDRAIERTKRWLNE